MSALFVMIVLALALAGWGFALALWDDRNDQRRKLYEERAAHADTHRKHARTRADLIACTQDEAKLVAYANGQMAEFEVRYRLDDQVQHYRFSQS